jgi:predicted nucleic acid-binding protein
MDKPRFMLDSNIVIGHLNNRLDLINFFEARGECEVFFNLVTEIEALAKPGISTDEEAAIRAVLGCFQWVDIDDAVRGTAILFRRANPKMMLLPDALIAASAIMLHATVLSNDLHLTKFTWPGYRVQNIHELL